MSKVTISNLDTSKQVPPFIDAPSITDYTIFVGQLDVPSAPLSLYIKVPTCVISLADYSQLTLKTVVYNFKEVDITITIS